VSEVGSRGRGDRRGRKVAAVEGVAQQPWDRSDWIRRRSANGFRHRRIPCQGARRIAGALSSALAFLIACNWTAAVLDGAIRSEMAIFSHLLRGRTSHHDSNLFLGKTDYDRRPSAVICRTLLGRCCCRSGGPSENEKHRAALAATGFSRMADRPSPARRRAEPGIGLDDESLTGSVAPARAVLQEISVA